MLQPFIFNGTASAAVNGDDIWYIGKGAKTGMYATYSIQYPGSSQPINMTLYFKDYDNASKSWVAAVDVVPKIGQHLNGTFYLSDTDMSVHARSNNSEDMAVYESLYAFSLDWLAQWYSKPGKPLDIPCKSDAFKCPPIEPVGNENITVQAGTFVATVLLWHNPNGADHKVWVDKNFPYPVKGETYHVIPCATSGPCPTNIYEFELLAFGQGQPPFTVPEFLINSLMLVAAIALFAVLIAFNKFQRAFGFASTP